MCWCLDLRGMHFCNSGIPVPLLILSDLTITLPHGRLITQGETGVPDIK